MIVYLLDHLFAASPSHKIEAGNVEEWRRAVAQIPPRRSGAPYACALVIPERDPVRPFPVQYFHGAEYPASCVYNGEFCVQVGLAGARVAQDQWDGINLLPGYLDCYDGFLSGVAQAGRRRIYPELASVAGAHSEDE